MTFCCCLCVNSFRFPELYPDTAGVEMIQKRLNTLIQEGVVDLARLRKVEPADTTPSDISSGGRRRAPKGGASNADVAASETARMTANNIEFVDAAATLDDSGTSKRRGSVLAARHVCFFPFVLLLLTTLFVVFYLIGKNYVLKCQSVFYAFILQVVFTFYCVRNM